MQCKAMQTHVFVIYFFSLIIPLTFTTLGLFVYKKEASLASVLVAWKENLFFSHFLLKSMHLKSKRFLLYELKMYHHIGSGYK